MDDVHARLDRLEALQAQFTLRLDDCWRCQQAASSAVSLRLDELTRNAVRAAPQPEQASGMPAQIAERFEVLSTRLDQLQSRIEGQAVPEASIG